MRLKADLCSSVFCGLTMRDVYRYWFSVGDGDEVDTHRDEKKKGCPCVSACTGGMAHISDTGVWGSESEEKTYQTKRRNKRGGSIWSD